MEIAFYEHYFLKQFPVLYCCSKEQEGVKEDGQRKLAGQARVRKSDCSVYNLICQQKSLKPFWGREFMEAFMLPA